MSEIEFMVIFLVVMIFGHFLYCRLSVAKETIKVADKGIVVRNVYAGDNSSSSVSDYMVYTTNGQAIKNTNCIWFWKFHSDELQGKLKKGKKYKIKTWGVRIPWLGLYKHIISATEIKTVKRKVIKK